MSRKRPRVARHRDALAPAFGSNVAAQSAAASSPWTLWGAADVTMRRVEWRFEALAEHTARNVSSRSLLNAAAPGYRLDTRSNRSVYSPPFIRLVPRMFAREGGTLCLSGGRHRSRSRRLRSPDRELRGPTEHALRSLRIHARKLDLALPGYQVVLACFRSSPRLLHTSRPSMTVARRAMIVAASARDSAAPA